MFNYDEFQLIHHLICEPADQLNHWSVSTTSTSHHQPSAATQLGRLQQRAAAQLARFQDLFWLVRHGAPAHLYPWSAWLSWTMLDLAPCRCNGTPGLLVNFMGYLISDLC